ncbi:MAG: High frequency lysogenization protein HflD [Cellvibrionales bacterium UBA7375]|nr:MAG: High frequency lysogenization protein HflD [Cellvibrionales bacterium UBA7375]
MFSKPSKQQALALAAIFQASNQVYKLAYNGVSDKETMSFAMSTLLNQDPDSLDQLYGSIDNLQDGLDSMKMFLENANNVSESKYKEVIGYVMSSIHLASKLSNDNELLTKIENGIDNARQQAEHFSITHDNVYSNVGSLYQDTISNMRLRIQVMGSAVYLQQSAVAARIRCMLFSAIRNAFLWRQLGGKRRHLLMQRKAFLKVINQL